MKFLVLIILVISAITGTSKALLESDSHSYILSTGENKILAIHKETGKESVIACQYSPRSMVFHGGFLYVSYYDAALMSIFDTSTHKLVKTLSLGQEPLSMTVYGSFGFVTDFREDVVYVIDLDLQKITKVIAIDPFPGPVVARGKFGYITHIGSNVITCLNLETQEQDNSIEGFYNGTHTLVCKDTYGYVLNFDMDNNFMVLVVDLVSGREIATINVGPHPSEIILQDTKGYVLCSKMERLDVIDLSTRLVTHSLYLGKEPHSLVIHKGMGYVHNAGSKTISVINLESMKIVNTIRNPDNLKIDFTDTHMYLGVTRLKSL